MSSVVKNTEVEAVTHTRFDNERDTRAGCRPDRNSTGCSNNESLNQCKIIYQILSSARTTIFNRRYRAFVRRTVSFRLLSRHFDDRGPP
ncbi:hypothetical protein PUN28_015367 [Cardiocondyla obscurior]|uniref:Uncharacterized protein n=1 Tax=Cardiocondyla obscurior TaxID=286306 RepID=A0AAW2EV78_9HYME